MKRLLLLTGIVGVTLAAPDTKDHKLITNLVLITLSLMFLIVMVGIGVRVYRIVKFKDPNILSIIFMLNMTMVAKIFFYICNAYYDQRADDPDKTPVLLLVSLLLPVMFLGFAVGMNLRQWIIYFIKISNMAYV